MIKWKRILLYREDGTSYLESPELEKLPGDKILEQIKDMPPGKPISVAKAYTVAKAASRHLIWKEDKSDEGFWILENWVLWTSQQGYRIELKGGEYKTIKNPPPLPDPGPQIIKLIMKVGDKEITFMTTPTRPPIQRVEFLSDRQVMVYYETGETEIGNRPNPDIQFYLLLGVLDEQLKGTPSKISKFKWAA